MANPEVNGILESALYVTDLERSCSFYRDLFGFAEIYAEGNRMRALSVCSKQVLLLFRQGGSTQPTDTPNGRIPSHDGSGSLHLAFSIAEETLQAWRDRLQARGISIESEVRCGGRSLYFRDPDGHLLELITPGCWSIY